MIRGLIAALILGSAATPGAAAVVVVYESGVEAFRDALGGVRAAIGPAAIQAVDLRTSDSESRLTQALVGDVQVVVAMGSPALAAVKARAPGAPVIATMILHPRDTSGISAYLEVELPFKAILAEIRTVLPQYRRVGIIRSPAAAPAGDVLELAARKEGYSALVLVSDGPANLLRAVKSLKDKVDFLLCLPDASLYNSVTIKPLLLAALEDRLPVIGFSPGFVQAGAAAGVYPDYYEIGRQTGELVLRALRGETRSIGETPRKARTAVNERVARLLGIGFQTGSGAVEVLR